MLPSDEWRHPEGDSARSRYVTGTILPPLNQAWQIKIAGQVEDVVACGDTIYLVGTDYLAAIDPSNGRVRWQLQGNGGADWPGVFQRTEAVATPFGLVGWNHGAKHRTNNDSNALICWNEQNGSERWVVNEEGWAGSAIALLNGDVLASMGLSETKPGRLFVLKGATGKKTAERSANVAWFRNANRYDAWAVQWPNRIGSFGGESGWLFAMGGNSIGTFERGPLGRARGIRWDEMAFRNGDYPYRADAQHIYKVDSGSASGPKLVALDRRCMLAWETLLPHEASYETRVSAITPRYVVLGGSTYGVVDKGTRRLSWFHNVSSRRIGEVLCVIGDTLYASSCNVPNEGGGFPDGVTAFRLKDGRELGSIRTGHTAVDRVTHIIAHRGALYVLQEDGESHSALYLTRVNGASR